jgi:hypothetical protein
MAHHSLLLLKMPSKGKVSEQKNILFFKKKKIGLNTLTPCVLNTLFFAPYASFRIIYGISFITKDKYGISIQKLTEVHVTGHKNRHLSLA